MNKLLILLTAVISFVVFPLTSHAQEMVSVKPILTKEQVGDIENYFNISTKGDFKQTLSYELSNKTDREVTVKVEALNALTSPIGSINYDKQPSNENSTLTDPSYAFSNYFDDLGTVTIPAKSSKIYSLDVNIPKLKGSILGAIGFTTYSEGDSIGGEDLSITINNEMNTVVATLIDFGGGSHDVITEEPRIINDANSFFIQLPVTSTSTEILDNSVIKYEVKDKKGKVVFHSQLNKKVSIVPQSEFDYLIPWEASSIEEDYDYTLEGTFTTIKGKEIKEFPFKHEINFKRGNKVDSSVLDPVTSTLNKSDPSVIIIILVAMVLALVSALLLVLIKTKKNANKQAEEITATTEESDLDYDEGNNFILTREEEIAIAELMEEIDYFRPVNTSSADVDSIQNFLIGLDNHDSIHIKHQETSEFESTISILPNIDDFSHIFSEETVSRVKGKYLGIYSFDEDEQFATLLGVCALK